MVSGDKPQTFWAEPEKDLLASLGSDQTAGLSSATASQRLAEVGPNQLGHEQKSGSFAILIGQFKSPVILLLLFAAVLSISFGEASDAVIILIIVAVSGFLGFWQEKGAQGAVAKLLELVRVNSTIVRDGKQISIPTIEVVPGDIVLLSAGDLIPADSRLLESVSLFVDEAALTGESLAVEKIPGILGADIPLSSRINCLFMGTHVNSGTAKAVIVSTGLKTEFGKISSSLRTRPPEAEFERGTRLFGYMLMQITLVLTFTIFAINVFLHKPVIDSLLFSLALAVGLTPQLLPAIISVNLAHGARRMATEKVIVKKLTSIENFGSMNVLCSDKTGTLTEGEVKFQQVQDVSGKTNARLSLLAYLNAKLQSGYVNPMDAALSSNPISYTGYEKIAEIPYDFERKRVTLIVNAPDGELAITKGSVATVIEVCTQIEMADGSLEPFDKHKDEIEKDFQNLSDQGFRTLALAYKHGPIEKKDVTCETELVFLGFLLFSDPLKPDIVQTIADLGKLGVSLKLITGDNRHIAANVAKQAGFKNVKVLAGPELNKVSQVALVRLVNKIDVFAEIEPSQKERIIVALKKSGHVVGYIGDGINDAPALHAADVGISVGNAVDVAREAAQIVLLEKDLGVLKTGIVEGRMTFANTMKYVFMATSANFGNMFSMAGASLFLNFLPLLPKQILMTNMLTDFPEMSISTDSVDQEMIDQPQRWDIGFIKRFMVVFGFANSACDFLTFAILLLVMHATPDQFRTGWFIENVVTAALIVLVVRTRKPFFRSRPSKPLIGLTIIAATVAVLLPYSPLAPYLGLVPLPLLFLFSLFGILIFYVLVAESAKFFFYRANRSGHVKGRATTAG